MPHLYKHIRHGWQINYRVHFPDGTHTGKTKHRRLKVDAQRMLSEVDILETHSRKNALTREEITFCLNMKYITQEEATRLAGAYISPYQTWDQLGAKYEEWSREECDDYTHMCNLSRLKGVKEAFKDIPPSEVKKEDIEAYIKRRRQKVKDDTIEKDLVVLRKLLDHVDPDNNPARKIKLTRRRDKLKKRPFGIKELQAFMEKLEEHKADMYGIIKEFVLIYLYAGMRPSEIIRLKPTDVRLDIKKIMVQGKTKTDHPRSIDIHPDLLPTIKYLLAHKSTDQYLLGRKLHPKSISRSISEILDAAGIQGVTPYSLRHSFVSYLLKHTRDLAYVMKQAGHKNIKTTEGYIDVIEDPESPINKLDFGLTSTTKKTTKGTQTTKKSTR